MNDKDTLYARWLSGELSVSELEQLKQSGELQELEAIIEATDRLAVPDFDAAGAYTNFKTKHSSTAKVRRIKRRQIAWISGIAASFLVLMLAVFLSNNRPQQIQAANKQNAVLELLDGSKVVLNDGSTLTYDKKNWKAERVVQLKGEGFFEVEKGGRFVVESANGKVSVLGTKFNVNTWRSQLYVECYEGSVEVQSKEERLILKAQQSASLRDGNLVLDSIINNRPLWQDGRSRFYDTPANEVFEALARQFDVKINAPLIQVPFSGSFEHSNLKNALEEVCKPLGLQFSMTPDQKEVFITEE
ncbi:MAG: FecR domain-containing protein [Bacteroidota bacterium]